MKLDGKRLAPFPIGKYHPLRILGAGGFGVAFLCKHKQLNASVVVKALNSDQLDRDVDEVFAEARILYQLEHPAIIRLLDCAYSIASEKSRPYLVMNFFEGSTLESMVRQKPLSVDELLNVAKRMAQGLLAAHSQGVFHRDVKPANVLVRCMNGEWQVKLIDFGLAMKQIGNASPSGYSKSLKGASIAGTLEYAAPEQLGRRNEPVGPYSDVYGFGKTCAFALFGTAQPTFQHWCSIPKSWAELLGSCLDEVPAKRPSGLDVVMERLRSLENDSIPTVLAAENDSIPTVLAVDKEPNPPLPSALPPLPDKNADQGYFDYIAQRGWRISLGGDEYRLLGPAPHHPDNLIAECQRVAARITEVFSGKTHVREEFYARFRSCLMGLEKWAYYYPFYRSDFINLWNQAAEKCSTELIDAKYFQKKDIVAKYTGCPARR
jgi:serine/threonine protein kinase